VDSWAWPGLTQPAWMPVGQALLRQGMALVG